MVEIKEFNGLYFIDNKGIIYRYRHGKLITMKTTINYRGYVAVLLYKNGKQVYRLVHRLLAQTFLSNPTNLPQVNHKDGNKTNNNLNNLEWCTASQNIKHAFETGLRPNSIGDKHHNSRQVMCIDTGVIYDTLKDAASSINKNTNDIWRVCSGKRKTTGGYRWKYI